jgi:hypothetical protein
MIPTKEISAIAKEMLKRVDLLSQQFLLRDGKSVGGEEIENSEESSGFVEMLINFI